MLTAENLPVSSSSLSGAHLSLRSFGNPIKFPIGDQLTVGRGEPATVRLDDPEISDRHLRIEKKPQGYLIRDLQSRSGTFVNETRILEAYLNPGDQIRLGSYSLTFQTEACGEDLEPALMKLLRSKNPGWDQEVLRLPQIAHSELPVLLLGPTGTGKELLAKTLHDFSKRARGAFVSVNCSAFSENLIESELFGHIKGSFTGASFDRKGAFESARGGTLFLDEVGDLSPQLQPKLLRALENFDIKPVGSDKPVKVDVRIIAATSQPLPQLVREGKFRLDLFYRLQVVQLSPPALRERLEDFEDLLFRFAKHYRVRFTHDAIQKLKTHSWPGNVRELKNVVARASALFRGEDIEPLHLRSLVEIDLIHPLTPGANGDRSVIKDFERQMIIEKLKTNRGNQRQTALELGIPKSTLHDRLKLYDINPHEFKRSKHL